MDCRAIGHGQRQLRVSSDREKGLSIVRTEPVRPHLAPFLFFFDCEDCRLFLAFRPLLKFFAAGSLLLALASQLAAAQPYDVVTVVGSSTQRVILDGTNSQARFHTPRHSALAPDGSIFVADDCVVRKLSRAGTSWVVTTIAGLPGQRSHVDGTNQAARFRIASGIVLDASGTLFVADYGSHTIRKLTLAGTNWIVTTIVGSPNTSDSADGVGSTARLNNPFGLAIDKVGNLFLADSSNETIRKISPLETNWVVSTIAGVAGQRGSLDGTNGSARFREPRGVTVDRAGTLFVSDRENSIVRKITPAGTNWIVQTIAGTALQKGGLDGVGEAARFAGPNGIACDGDGALTVSDTENNNLRRLILTGEVWSVSTVAGGTNQSGSNDGIGEAARFNYPDDVQVDADGILYVSDRDNFSFRMARPLQPALKIVNEGSHTILRWPLAYTGYSLERAGLVEEQSWQVAVDTPGVYTSYWAVTNSTGSSNEFFRLRKP